MEFATVKAEHDQLVAEKKRLEAALNVIRIDPKVAAKAAAAARRAYRHIMRGLRSNGPKISAETTEMKRAITDLVGGRIDVVPREDGGLDAVMYGDYMAAFRIATTKQNGPRTKAGAIAESLVAGTCNRLCRTVCHAKQIGREDWQPTRT